MMPDVGFKFGERSESSRVYARSQQVEISALAVMPELILRRKQANGSLHQLQPLKGRVEISISR